MNALKPQGSALKTFEELDRRLKEALEPVNCFSSTGEFVGGTLAAAGLWSIGTDTYNSVKGKYFRPRHLRRLSNRDLEAVKRAAESKADEIRAIRNAADYGPSSANRPRGVVGPDGRLTVKRKGRPTMVKPVQAAANEELRVAKKLQEGYRNPRVKQLKRKVTMKKLRSQPVRTIVRAARRYPLTAMGLVGLGLAGQKIAKDQRLSKSRFD